MGNSTKEDLALVKKTIEILDSYKDSYNKLSHGRYSDYLSYISTSTHPDEQTLTKSMFTDFLRGILGFPPDGYIPEERDVVGERPDFRPYHTRLHPFVFEIKGSEEHHLENHLKQLFDYVETQGVSEGVITNMRELSVYNPPFKAAIPDYSFSFARLYENYRDNKDSPQKVLEYSNTKRFLAFCEKFKHRKATQEDKIKAIREAKVWTDKVELNIEQLDAAMHRVTRMLRDDAHSQKKDLSQYLVYEKTRLKNVATEFEDIACQLDSGRQRQPVDGKSIEKFLNAREGTIESKAFGVYLSRLAYFAMTRILLARVWEDIGLIDQSLYDGGFDRWYENFKREIQKVLEYAFGLAARHYPWLYHAENNYKWFTPSPDTVVDVLYEFSEFNLGRLNTDVLGTVYEKYVEDRFERKNKGLFYTPREIIRFIWNRVGFTNDEAFFRFEEDSREPRYIFDPATGSGGFLVEAARRIVENAHYDRDDLESLFHILHCLMEGVQGSEISVFAHYITEVNLLIQFTPLIKYIARQRDHLKVTPSLKLSTVATDSMGLLIDPIGRKSKLTSDEANNHVDLTVETRGDPTKARTYLEIKGRKDYDYCCANPPYIGEKGHKELFRYTLDRFPVWNTYYQGKMDYFYWFVILGLSKLREGGKLGYITTHYWPTADGASKLRRFILDNALILEMIDFGEIRIFDNAPGQHNMVFVLERLKGTARLPENSNPNEANKRKQNNRIKIVRVKKDLPKEKNNNGISRLGRLTARIQEHIDKDSYEDEFIEVYWSPVKQGELDKGPWSGLFGKPFRHQIIEKIRSKGEPLVKGWKVTDGVETGVDKVAKKHLKLLPKAILDHHNIQIGDGIFVVSPEELQWISPSDSEAYMFKPLVKNSDLDSYFVEATDEEYLIYMPRGFELKEGTKVFKHLEKYKSALLERREFKSGKLPWYELHWPREQDILDSEKLFSPYRAHRPTFSYCDIPLYANRDVRITSSREGTREELFWLCGILNSKLILLWLEEECKHKGDVLELTTTPLRAIPIRRIDFSKKRDMQRHDRMVELVKAMIETKKELAQYSPYYEGIRLTRLEGPEGLKDRSPDPLLVCKDLPQNQRRLLKFHPNLSTVEKVPANFILTSPGKTDKDIVEGFILTLRGKGKKQAIIKGEKEFLKYLQGVLANRKGAKWEEIKNLPMPLDTSVLNERIKEIEKEAKRLLRRVASLQKRIDELVYKLYDLTKDEIAIVKGENQGS